MTIQARMQGSYHRLASHFGGGSTVTIRRPHTLRNEADGAQLTVLAVNGTTALGASSIDLDSPNLVGTLPADITFLIAGDSTTYTVQIDKIAASDALTGVSFLPVLAAEAADDAVVTIGSTPSYSAAACCIAPTEKDMENTLVHSGSKILMVSSADLSIELRDTDETEWDSVREPIAWIREKNTTGTPSGYRLVVGAR